MKNNWSEVDTPLMAFVVVDGDPQRTIISQQPLDDLQPVPHQRQPDGMLDPVVIMGEGVAGIVRRIDEHALHLAGKLLLQGLQGQQVVTEISRLSNRSASVTRCPA